MKFNDLIGKLIDSDECSWIECNDEYATRYICKGDINISIYVPYNESYKYKIKDPNHILNKNMMEKDDLEKIKAYVQYNGINILQLDMYHDVYDNIYLPSQSQRLDDDTKVYYAPRWISDLAFFMSGESNYYYDKLRMLEIQVEDLDY